MAFLGIDALRIWLPWPALLLQRSPAYEDLVVGSLNPWGLHKVLAQRGTAEARILRLSLTIFWRESGTLWGCFAKDRLVAGFDLRLRAKGCCVRPIRLLRGP